MWSRLNLFWFFSLLILSALVALGLRAYLVGNPMLRGHMIGFDFVNLWSGAQLVLQGEIGRLFDFNSYNEFLRANFGAKYEAHSWSYPLHLLLFIYPLGEMDYFPALFVWSVVTLLIYVWGLRQLGFAGRDLVLLAVSPAATMNILCGQTGLLVAGLLFAAFANVERRPWLAGLCAGLLTIKPQFGLLIPLLVLVHWQWRVVLSGAITFITLFGLSVWWFGFQPWLDFRNHTMPLDLYVMLSADLPSAMPMRPGLGAGLQILGYPASFAFAVQIAISVGLIVASLWLLWPRRDSTGAGVRAATGPQAEGRMLAFLLMATLMAMPYLHNYDLTIMAPVVIWCWRDRMIPVHETPVLRTGLRLILIAAWLLPWIVIPFNVSGIPLGPIILAGLTGWTMLAFYRGRDSTPNDL